MFSFMYLTSNYVKWSQVKRLPIVFPHWLFWWREWCLDCCFSVKNISHQCCESALLRRRYCPAARASRPVALSPRSESLTLRQPRWNDRATLIVTSPSRKGAPPPSLRPPPPLVRHVTYLQRPNWVLSGTVNCLGTIKIRPFIWW